METFIALIVFVALFLVDLALVLFLKWEIKVFCLADRMALGIEKSHIKNMQVKE